MKKFVVLCFILLSFGSIATAMDEEDIPAPSKPDYLEQELADLEASQEDASDELTEEEELELDEMTIADIDPEVTDPLKEESRDEIKEEFLQVAEDSVDLEEPDLEEEASIEELVAEAEKDLGLEEVVEEKVKPAPRPVAQKKAPAKKKAPVKVASVKAKPVKKAIAKKTRKVASVKKSFKSGLYRFKKNCTMFSKPNQSSSKQGSISSGKKLWIDPHNSGWHKAYKKSGTVYIPSSCLSR